MKVRLTRKANEYSRPAIKILNLDTTNFKSFLYEAAERGGARILSFEKDFYIIETIGFTSTVEYEIL